ncbi:MAG: hypothetical protein HC872_06665, partial [Gammaproteobacteria bacterium]|nr:hypothetical protein [Gammaproteobacteria bacterium]
AAAARCPAGSDQELQYGHGGVALRTGNDDVVAQFLGAASVAADLVDSYRETGAQFDYGLEERWVRDEGYLKLVPQAVAQALETCAVRAEEVQHFVLPAAAAIARKVAQQCGLKSAKITDALDAKCGNTGAAHPLLMLAAALEQAAAGETLLLVGLGRAPMRCCCGRRRRSPGSQARQRLAGSWRAVWMSRITCVIFPTVAPWRWTGACAPSATIAPPRASPFAGARNSVLSSAGAAATAVRCSSPVRGCV